MEVYLSEYHQKHIPICLSKLFQPPELPKEAELRKQRLRERLDRELMEMELLEWIRQIDELIKPFDYPPKPQMSLIELIERNNDDKSGSS